LELQVAGKVSRILGDTLSGKVKDRSKR
jgi:hypothetical protein